MIFVVGVSVPLNVIHLKMRSDQVCCNIPFES